MKILMPLMALAHMVTASAAEKKADKVEKAPKEGFETTLSAGLMLTDGNSETLVTNGSLITEGEKEGPRVRVMNEYKKVAAHPESSPKACEYG
jgi:hypothetical protein